MGSSKGFDDILNKCLEAVLSGDTIEQCLTRYPEYAAELKPLLETILLTKEAIEIKPRHEFRERAKYEFQSALQETEQPRGSWLFGWHPQWAAVLASVLVLVLGGGGVVAAAADSMPDQVLYPVKLTVENVRVALTPSSPGKAELYASLVDKRVVEIAAMAEKGKVGEVEKTTDLLSEQIVAMASLVSSQGGGTPQLMRTEKVSTAIEQTPAAAPAPALLGAPPAEGPSEGQPQDKAGQAPVPAPRPAPPGVALQDAPPPVIEIPAPAPETPVTKGKVGKVDKETRLKELLAEKAARNKEKLEEALGKSPPSVRAAVERAAEIADNGYAQALNSLD